MMRTFFNASALAYRLAVRCWVLFLGLFRVSQ